MSSSNDAPQTPTHEARFARQLLHDNCHEKSFEVWVAPDMISAVEAELRKLGCAVTSLLGKSMLVVECPMV